MYIKQIIFLLLLLSSCTFPFFYKKSTELLWFRILIRSWSKLILIRSRLNINRTNAIKHLHRIVDTCNDIDAFVRYFIFDDRANKRKSARESAGSKWSTYRRFCLMLFAWQTAKRLRDRKIITRTCDISTLLSRLIEYFVFDESTYDRQIDEEFDYRWIYTFVDYRAFDEWGKVWK